MKLKQRLFALCMVAIAGLLISGGISLYAIKKIMVHEREDQITELVELARAATEKAYALEQSGKLSREAAQAQAKLAISSFQKGDKYFFVRDNTSDVLLVHAKPERIGKADKDGKASGDAYREALKSVPEGGITVIYKPGTRPGVEGKVSKAYAVTQFTPWQWLMGFGTYTDDIEEEFIHKLITFLMVGGVAALTIGLVAWRLANSLLRQIGGEPDYAASVVRNIAQGDLSTEVPVSKGDQESLLHEIEEMRQKLALLVEQVRTGAESITTASGEIASGNLDLSQRTEQQAGALEETSSTVEQLTATVRQNADNARQASQLAMSASGIASEGGTVVNEVVSTMAEISNSSGKIVDIISVIDGIAFQTNILALNAAVEAARAGEQGRGFAVVASEVRSLAQRSAAAAKEIKTLIDASVVNVEKGGELVEKAGKTMHEVVQAVQRVNDIVAEISSASQEQADGIVQVNQAVIEMDNMTQQNAALVEQASAAAEALHDQADSLVETVNMFRVSQQHLSAAPHSAPQPARKASAASPRAATRALPRH
ncbi:methyl-accepting chemotaxis protein [Undibacterium luofuense]|uniref:Cache domain-containing protein n=1 Tax=Undibacterium luofuense TaxID=2828733 RepID=A0A941DP79_9BURK|nr:methyl-accepting chemotaxis protein [Undibacterium luofuense]MBR7781576.1 cache domain-containing protein [Undibacterium luofuense]